VLKPGAFAKVGIGARIILYAVVAGLLAGGLAVPAVGAVGLVTRNETNSFNNMKAGVIGQLPVRSQILDSKGRLLAYFYPRGIDREPVTFNQISPVMRKAIVAIEDSRFYQHGAIDVRGTLRAIVYDLEHKQVQGGSTLTQQYVKNALILTAPNPEMAKLATSETLSRKIKELRLAIDVEGKMTKDQILAGYLNAAFFGAFYGNQAVGVGAAAERYFDTTAAKLTLPEAAVLAGMVENPSLDNPVTNPKAAIKRRNVVLARMAQLHIISQARAVAVGKQGLGLHLSPLQSGCTSASAKSAAFFCDYVLSLLKQNNAFSEAWNTLNTSGGLKIYTTLSRKDERAAKRAVNYMVPQPPSGINPGGNADSEVLIQPGTGHVLAIANNRSYGFGKHQTTVNYAVNSPYDGGVGVQTGSSSKLFTLVTALEQGVPFGFPQTVPAAANLTGFNNCKGQPIVTPWHVINDSQSEKGGFSLYNATAQSVNIYFGMLERKVGLCNVVKTADALGVTRADGRSLLKWDGKNNPPADDLPSFTLGSVNVSPMSMAAAYATVAARGMYCQPIVVARIISGTGARLPVQKPHCHQVMPTGVADATSYVLQSVLTVGTAAGLGIGRPAAGKTGTSDNFDFAAFGGYTPNLAGYVSVFNPVDPIKFPMSGTGSCYRGGCPGEMFGADAPAHTWQMTFLHANLANPAPGFFTHDIPGELWSMGSGVNNPAPPKKPGKGGHGNGNGPGGGGPGGGGPGPGGGGGGGGGGGNGGGPPN
jgi:membrane peptidoglycan carboxypeptidase